MLPVMLDILTQPTVLLATLAGVVAGLSLGVLPGLTATMGIVLVIPFTYVLEPLQAFGVLLGIYVAGLYAGALSAILIRTPGTPAAAATLLDGYPMAQRGEAGRAIGIATFASFAGGMFSALALALVAPVLARYALRFGPPEFFALATFGLTIIVTLSHRNLAKGLAAGLLGLFIATVGVDPILGAPRFTFGIPQLLSGVDFVVALIGLFAIGEVLVTIERTDRASRLKARFSGLLRSLGDVLRYWWCWLTSALIGTFIGVLPGVGATVAPWISYDMARRIDRGRSPFGTGIPQGIIATETANNATTGGAMITLVALGLPGDVVTAILIGALMIQGLTPGPRLFADNPDVVYGLISLLMIGNVLMLIVGLSCARVLARVVSIPRHLLLPVIVVFSVLGAYAINNDPFDVWLMLSFGVLGYAMRRFGFPVAPLILALVLGPIVETQFRRSLVIGAGDYAIFVTRPISATLLAVATIALVLSIVSAWRQRGDDGAPAAG